jgi:hypothetical protein
MLNEIGNKINFFSKSVLCHKKLIKKVLNCIISVRFSTYLLAESPIWPFFRCHTSWLRTRHWQVRHSSYPEPSGFPFFMELLQYSCIRSLNISSTLPNGRQHRLTVQIKNLGLSHDCPRSQNHSLIVTIYCLMVQRYRISKNIPNFLTTFFPIS